MYNVGRVGSSWAFHRNLTRATGMLEGFRWFLSTAYANNQSQFACPFSEVLHRSIDSKILHLTAAPRLDPLLNPLPLLVFSSVLNHNACIFCLSVRAHRSMEPLSSMICLSSRHSVAIPRNRAGWPQAAVLSLFSCQFVFHCRWQDNMGK